MFRRSIVALSLLGLMACEAAPTGPSASVGLSLSQVSLTLGRNATSNVTATLGSAARASDVTSAAAWSSSDPAVVSVEAGVLRAVGLGSATVTASYRGRSATAHVTVRRNTTIAGRIVIREVTGKEIFGCLAVSLTSGSDFNAGSIGGRCGSDHFASVWQSADFGWATNVPSIRARSAVAPGTVGLGIRVSFQEMFARGVGPRTLATDDGSYVEIFDADTGESLDRSSLPRHEAVLGDGDVFTLPVTVKTYTQ